MILNFSYNFEDLVLTQSEEFGVPLIISYIFSSVVKGKNVNHPSHTISLTIKNDTLEIDNVEVYSIYARENETSDTTIGTLQWTLFYQQKPRPNNQTLLPILYGRVETASGIFCKYINSKVRVEYDNTSAQKPRKITIQR